ncbi:uncharacterized protein LOC125488651 [Plutella xylostella]|uniref:uncharacterized protein LOC125488651 n=1 Tax=Plutella xylostella TaxID=51655 RepID=UPI00203238BF|nr:uncharacterized protein LOC125488651 [Plutella xylostella]
MKMAEELMQGIEKKFQVDLQRSVDQVLLKIKVFLNNGSSVVQHKLQTLEEGLADLRHTLQDKQAMIHYFILCGSNTWVLAHII